MKLFVVTHKNFSPPEIEGYIPIQVGKSFTGLDLGYLSDDVGDTISEKNKTYCELTAQYWIWKNEESSDIIGLCHYRRYFTRNSFSKSSKYFMSQHDVNRILNNYDIIMPKKIHMKYSVEEKYSLSGVGFQKDLDTLRSLIFTEYPNFVIPFEAVMKSKEQYFWNMFVTNRKQFDAYSKWIFEVLAKYEKMICISDYTDKQKRIFGYISERLINVWLLKNKLKVYEFPVVQTDRSYVDTFKTALGVRIKKRRV